MPVAFEPIAFPRWRPTALSDLPAVGDIERQVHSFAPERQEVHAERLALFPDGHRVLETADGALVGYAVSYPWRLASVPKLDTFLGRLPDVPQTLFIHDVALLPQARGAGAAAKFTAHVTAVARAMGLRHLSLVSVYGTFVVWQRLGFEIHPPPGPPDALRIYGDTARYMIADLPA